jgi:AraC family transcriptional regulator, transcriptional activator of pobA
MPACHNNTCHNNRVPPPHPGLAEVRLHEGARLFVAAYALLSPPLAGAHRYTFYSLSWLSGAAATLHCDAERFEVTPDSLICLAPGQVHWWEEAGSGAHLTLLGFLPEIFTDGVLDVRLLTDLPLFRPDETTIIAAPGERGAAVATLFRQVWQRYQQLAPQDAQANWRTLPRQRESLMLAYLHAVLAEAATLGGAAAPTLPLGHSADLRLTRLFRIHAVQSAVQRHPLTHYAALLHVTPDHLTRVVRRVSGKTPHAWLQERLLTEAVRLLTFTTRPIERVADDLHFPSATQFSQWFRAQHGQTPRQVRQGSRAPTLHQPSS